MLTAALAQSVRAFASLAQALSNSASDTRCKQASLSASVSASMNHHMCSYVAWLGHREAVEEVGELVAALYISPALALGADFEGSFR